MTGYLSVKNFKKFQHYRDRTPPWIKLYNDILEDYTFYKLPDTTKAHLILLWLLASRSNNRLPNDAQWLADKIGATSPIDLEILIDSGFLLEADEAPETRADGWGTRHITKEVKKVVRDRDRGKCTSCGASENIEYDHITPVSSGGTSEPDNLQLLCRSCSRKKRARSTRYAAAEQPAPHTKKQATQKRSLEREREGETEGEKKEVVVVARAREEIPIPDIPPELDRRYRRVGEEVLRRMGVLDDPRWFGNYARVHQWLADGLDPEMDIYPVVDRLMAQRNGEPPGSLAYFDRALADHRASRQKPMPEGKSNGARIDDTERRRAGLAAAVSRRLEAGVCAADGQSGADPGGNQGSGD